VRWTVSALIVVHYFFKVAYQKLQ